MRQENEIKGHKQETEKSNYIAVTYVRDSNDCNFKLIEEIKSFSYVTGYRISLYKLIAFLYAYT